MLLLLRTDSDIAELAIVDADGNDLAAEEWQSGRQLAEGLLAHLGALLKSAGITWSELGGIVVYVGPGSFTGLRIGITVANTIAYAQNLPIVGVSGQDWRQLGRQRLLNGDNDGQVKPEYGAPPNITRPKR